MPRDKWVLKQILYTELFRINLGLYCARLWFMEALLTSCSGLALQLKRLTEMNMFIWNRFSRGKKKSATSAESSRKEKVGKKWFWNDSSLKVQWGTAFQRRNTYLEGWRYGSKANKYSFLDSLAGSLPFLQAACSEATWPLQRQGWGSPFRAMHQTMVRQVVHLLRREAVSCFAIKPILVSTVSLWVAGYWFI